MVNVQLQQQQHGPSFLMKYNRWGAEGFFFLPKRDWRGPTAKMDECYFTIIVVWQRWTTPLFIYLTSRSSKYKMSSACVFQFLSERLSTRPECYFSIVEQTTRKRDEIIKYDDSPVGPSLYFSFPLSCKCCVSLFFLSVRENSPALTLCCWFWAGATTVRVGLCVIVGFSVLWLREGDGSAGGMSKEWGKIATGTHRQKKNFRRAMSLYARRVARRWGWINIRRRKLINNISQECVVVAVGAKSKRHSTPPISFLWRPRSAVAAASSFKW